ncbi:MAG: TonB-dependent receptor [Aliiglaciecola sp.]|uniref:TonB-dependent receptor n=1 Tax=Aliiglaciecola sp. TaxID=1872441 RepID=UPI0032983DE6
MKVFNMTMLALSINLSLNVSAQTTVNNDGAEKEGSNDQMIEQITITAQRRSESLQDAAIPINAASGAQMERMGISDAIGLNKIAPALTVSTGGGANTAYFIRGVGNFTNNGYTNPAVSFNIDGVYIGRPSSTISSFLDLDRVEVLKGPQGTLYGRNSTGGAINVVSKAPVLNENSGSIKLGVGNYSAYDLTGIGNFEVTDDSAIRLAGVISKRDGYFSDGTSDADDMAMRASYYIEASQDLNMRISADYSTQKGVGAGVQYKGYYAFAAFQSDLPVPNWNYIPAPDSISADFAGLHHPDVLAYIQNNVAGAPGHMPYGGFVYPKRDDSYWGINAEINYDMDWAQLTVIPSHRVSKLDNQFNGPPFKAAINKDEAKQSSIEARLTGDTDNFQWILGALYFDENVQGINSFNQFSTVSHNDWESDVESTSLFARGTYSVTDTLRLVGGIRLTEDSYEISATQTATAAICLEHPEGRAPFCPQIPSMPVALTLAETIGMLDPALFPTGSPLNDDGSVAPGARPYGPLNYFAPAQFGPGAIFSVTPGATVEDDSDSQTTYRVAVEYDLTSKNLLYTSFETGFRAGGFNLSPGRETYDPEYIDAYTIGSKNRFLNNRLELNLEAFYWEYEDQQLAALGLDTNGNNAFYTRNVGASTIKGLEVDFRYALAAGTLLRGSAQFLDAVYDSYEYIQVDLSDAGIDPPNFLTPVNTCENTLGIFDGDVLLPYDPALDVEGAKRGFTVDCSGKDALNAPDLSLTLGIQQTIELDGFALIGNLDARYRGARELGFNYVPGGRASSDVTVDASLTLASNDGHWTVNAFVRNLTDEAIAATYQLGSGNIAGSAYEAPRTYGISVNYEF